MAKRFQNLRHSMNQKFLSPLFALLLFVAHLNCVLEHGISCVDTTATVGQGTGDLPVDTSSSNDSDECEHGCICKGATLAESYVFSSFELSDFGVDFLAADMPAMIRGNRAELSSAQSHRVPIPCSPLRALERCAMLQIFLI